MKRLRSASRAACRGVTLVEAAAVAASVAVVAGGLALWLAPQADAENQEAALATGATISGAVQQWQQEGASGCPTITQLQHERYLSRSASTEDPWGARFRIKCTDNGVEVTSPGRDGKRGTSDDVRLPIE